MPKPMLRTPVKSENTRADNLLSTAAPRNESPAVDVNSKMKLDRYLRKKRSKAYMDAIGKLDAGGHARNDSAAREIIDALRDEFPEVRIESVLLGIVDKCYLGAPYEVHTLSLQGSIIEHYVGGAPLPGRLEAARSIAMSGSYDFIEVYSDCLRAVSPSGAVSVIVM